MVKLRGVSTRSIGVVLARVSLPELKCHGYQVITIMPEGLAKRLVELHFYKLVSYLYESRQCSKFTYNM